MNQTKIRKANEIYSKIQGIEWAKEKNEEYEHYGACEECRKAISELRKELKELNLTEEERTMVGYEFVDYSIAYKYEGMYR